MMFDRVVTPKCSERGSIHGYSAVRPRVRLAKSRCDDIKLVKKWGIPGAEAYPLGDDIQVMPLQVAMRELADRRVD
jgi:hypothetical protein